MGVTDVPDMLVFMKPSTVPCASSSACRPARSSVGGGAASAGAAATRRPAAMTRRSATHLARNVCERDECVLM